jgi:PAS domain S-box-containing protein
MRKKTDPLLVLLAEDDSAHAAAIQRALENGGSEIEVKVVGTLREFRRRIVDRPPNIAIMDLNLPDGRATEVLTSPPEAGPFPILVMTSYGNEQVAVEAIKAGALEYVVKSPETFADMSHTIAHALQEWNLRQERKRAEEALEFKNVILVTQQETSLDGILVVDENGEIISFNRRFIDLWGIPPTMAEPKSDEKVLQLVMDKLVKPEEFVAKLEQLYENREETSRDEITLQDGRTVDRYSAPMIGEGGKHYGRVWYFRDITERKRAENELQKVNRALRLTSQCNQEIVRATDEVALLQAVCRIAVEHGGYRLAWVGFAEQDEARSVRPVAQAGFEEGYLSALNITWADVERGRGPTGAAIRTRKPVLTRDIPTEPAFAPWRAEAIQRGYVSSIALPLLNEGCCLGALMMYSGVPDAFDPKEIELLAELANDVAYGISAIRHRSERKQAEEALGERQRQLATLMSNLPGMAYRCRNDQDWTMEFVSDGAQELTGYSASELTSNRKVTFASLIHPDDRKAVWDQVQAGLKRNEPFVLNYRLRTATGEERWVWEQGRGIFDSQRQLLALEGFITNITDRKRAEEALRASQEQLRQIFEASPNVTSVFRMEDKGLQRTWVSPNLERLFGYTVQEALQPHWWSAHVHPEDVARVITDSARILAREHIVHEYRFLRRDGSAVWIRDELRLLRDAADRPLEVVGAWTDITERKELETHLLRTQRLESVGRLASGIAHDLNNILSPMLMVPPLLREAVKDPELLKMVDLVDTNAQRGSSIIKQLLTFGRGMEGERVPVQLRSLVSEMSGIIRETFHKSITVHQETPRDIWLVSGDATQLHQVLMNLCVNARDAMPDGGTLTLKLENLEFDESFARMTPGAKSGRYVCLSVTDTGQGIAPEHLDKIFDPFFTTKEVGKGTGLGLSTVLGIVQSHEGFIQVHSQPGRGTQFKIYLPACETAGVPSAAETNKSVPKGNGELVLVVDDEKSVRDVTRKLLERNGYHVIEAAEGAEGITQYVAHQKEVQLVLTDLAMPIMDGPAFIRVLRRLNPQVPLIAMTGYQSKSSLPADLGVPNEDRLSKPFNGVVLLRALHRLLHPETAAKN